MVGGGIGGSSWARGWVAVCLSVYSIGFGGIRERAFIVGGRTGWLAGYLVYLEGETEGKGEKGGGDQNIRGLATALWNL